MARKAQHSLRSALHLVDIKNDVYLDSAANRLYYAVYQAARSRFTRSGHKATDWDQNADGPEDWTHSTVRSNARAARGTPSDRDLLRGLWQLREQADYQPMPVERDRLEEYRDEAEEFVEEVTR